MLSVNNATTWENYFKQISIKKCGIFLRDKNINILVDSKKITKFSISSRNSYVCEKMPTDDCTVEIAKWSSLSSSTKTYLQAQKNLIIVSYAVENDETTSGKVLCIESCTVVERKDIATLHLVSPFNFYYKNLPPFSPIKFGILEGALPLKATVAEVFQHLAIGKAGALYYPNTEYDLSDYPYAVKNYVVAVVGNFNKLNYSNFEYYDVTDKSSIRVFGINSGTNTSIGYGDGTTVYSHNLEFMEWNWYSDQMFHYDGIDFAINLQTKVPTIYRYPNAINISYSGSASTSHTWTASVRGFLATYENIPNNLDFYIQTPTLVKNSTRLTNAQNFFREYLGHYHCIKIDGRIDPRFEPLDLINVDGKVLAIEEITINFNGGYSGTIKGRYIMDISLVTPVISNLSYNASTFSFRINNNSPVDVVAKIEYSSGTISKTISAGSYIVVNNSNTPELRDSFNAKYQGSLAHDVYTYFTHPDFPDSQSVIIIGS